MKEQSKDKESPRVFLSTCDRVEIYQGDGEIPKDIANHLFRVTSGLESPIVGETAIQGQVKEAYKKAAEKFELSKSLHKLFQTSLMVGKKVRELSGISQGAVSHAQGAIDLIRENGIELSKSKVFLLGNGDVIRKSAKFLSGSGAKLVFIGSRAFEKGEELAHEFGGEAIDLAEFYRKIMEGDLLITATSAPHVVIKREKFPPVKNLLIVDLAMPRDVDPTIGEVDGVKLFNISDVEKNIRKKIEARKDKVIIAEKIIEDELERFYLKNA